MVKRVSNVRQSTQEYVLDVSANFFNSYGLEGGSVSQIAEAAKISPGNLTYHYRKKSDLIAAHINVFEKRLREGIEHLPLYSNPKTFSEAYVDLLSLTLQYRFLFVGANYIIQNDLVPTRRYQKLIDVVKRAHVGHYKRLIAGGYMLPVKKPYNLAMLVDGIWWQWLGWLIAMRITPKTKAVSPRKLVADCVLHIFFLSHHYVEPDFFRAVQTELKRIGRSKAR